MTRILITGGRGGLGRLLVPRFQSAGYTVRISSRRERPTKASQDVEWATMSLETGVGIEKALDGVDMVVHAASNAAKPQQSDVVGTQNLLKAMQGKPIDHLHYISIVGVDKIPFAYYKAKYQAEQDIEASGIPHTILRATQFHSLVDMFFGLFKYFPILPVPTDFRVQPIDEIEVADHIVEWVQKGASGRVPDIGGPAVRTGRELVDAWKQARGMHRPVVRLPLPGQTAQAFREGRNTVPENPFGQITFEEWLAKRYGQAQPATVTV